MIGETLTYENLKKIHESMSNIAEIDRSDFFNNYYKEIIERMNVYERMHLKFGKTKAQTVLGEPGNGKTK